MDTAEPSGKPSAIHRESRRAGREANRWARIERLAERYRQAAGQAERQWSNDSPSHTSKPLGKTPDTHRTIRRAIPASSFVRRRTCIERFAERYQQVVEQVACESSNDSLSDTSKPLGKPTDTHRTIRPAIPASRWAS
jgi:hypothetical protein